MRRGPAAWLQRCGLALLGFALCAMLGSCGGGQVAGVGSGGSGVAEGSVTGFGSVLVDGVEYDDSALDPTVLATLRLGQRVRLTFDANSNTAQSLQLLLQLSGPVDMAPDHDGFMKVTGQWVRLVQSAADSSRSGVTALGGFSSTGQIAAGQDVAAYGSWAWDDSKAAYVLVASRIERVDTPGSTIVTGGVVRGLAGNVLTLNADGGTRVATAALPTLSVGQVVAVQVARTPSSSLAPAGVLQAQSVQNTSLGALDLAPYATVRVGGLATDYDPAVFMVTVQGTRLQLAVPTGTDAGALAARQFVRVDGATADGTLLTAGTAVARSAPGTVDATGGINEIKGALSGINWSAATVSFTLRNVAITASAAAIDGSCRSAPTGTTLYVETDGMAPAPGAAVAATRVSCTVTATTATR